MLSKTGFALSLLGLTTVYATPMNYRLEDIQCRCLSFSTTAKPSVCTYVDFHGLDWQTAFSLATDNDLKIQFASQDTISKVLAIPKPLPSSMLASLGRGEGLPPSSRGLKSQDKILCGLGDEVKHIGNSDSDRVPGNHCVGLVTGVLMLCIILYAVGQHMWTRCSGPQQGGIKLEGDEKALTAGMADASTTSVS